MAKGIKTGGRVKGTPNKVSGDIRMILSEIVSMEIERIPHHLSQIEPERRMNLLVKLLPYVVPVVTERPGEATKEDPIAFIMSINKSLQDKGDLGVSSAHNFKSI